MVVAVRVVFVVVVLRGGHCAVFAGSAVFYVYPAFAVTNVGFVVLYVS